ncbi:MAG: sialidase family protein [Candidatus Hadarchaeum sp.]
MYEKFLCFKLRNDHIYFLLALLLLTAILGTMAPARAQSTSPWTPPVKFFEVEPGGEVQSPTLVSDPAGGLHAFWSAKVDVSAPSALYHSRWLGDRWSEPVDVLFSTFPTTVVVGKDNYFHAFWHFSKQLYYSKAPLAEAGDARQWAAPQPLSSIGDGGLGITQDQEGTWYLAYAEDGLAAIKILRSKDNWSTFDQITVATNENPAVWLAFPSIAVAADGSLWLSWNELTSAWQGNSRAGVRERLLGVRSLDGGETWTRPEVIIEGYYNGGYRSVGDILVRLVAGGLGTGGRFVSFSYDSGNTWTEPINIGLGGAEGMQGIGLAIDSRGVWHFLVETSSTFAEVPWQDGIWSTPQLVVGRELLQECCVTPGEVTENGVIGVSNGNRLHVIFEEANRTLWWSQKTLDAPFVSAALPEPSRESQVYSLAPTSADAQRVAIPESMLPAGADEKTTSPVVRSFASDRTAAPWHPIAAGTLSALLVVVVAVLARKRLQIGGSGTRLR